MIVTLDLSISERLMLEQLLESVVKVGMDKHKRVVFTPTDDDAQHAFSIKQKLQVASGNVETVEEV